MSDTLKEIFFSVSQWLRQNRENQLPTSQGIYPSAIAGNLYYHLHKDGNIISEMEAYGLKTLGDLNRIIPNTLEESLREISRRDIYEAALVIRILLINDYNKYFSNVPRDDTWVWTVPDDEYLEEEMKFFRKYRIEWKEIYRKYGAQFSPEQVLKIVQID